MDAINAIIVRCPSAHETTLYTRQPCQQTWQERCESVVSIMTILILRRQLLSQERQTPQHKRNKHKTKKWHSTRVTADRSSKIMPQISRDKRGFNNKTYKKDFASKTKKTKPSWHVRHASGAKIAGQAATQITLQSHWRCCDFSLENTDTQICIERCAKVFPLHTEFFFICVSVLYNHDFFVK